MYRNVMVPVDGSSFSREAVLQGLRLASYYGATLHLVKVARTPMPPTVPVSVAINPAAAGDANARDLASLYALAAECRANSNVVVKASLENGPIVDCLVSYAHRARVDLIVMRTHARRGLARVWFGSVTDGLIRDSAIPVLVVRPPSVNTALNKGVGMMRVLVPLDGSALAEQALEPALALARADGGSITLLRIVTAWKEPQPGILASTLGPASAVEVSEAQRYLDSVLSWPDVGSIPVKRRVVISSDPATAILQMSDDIEADVIALATRGYGAIKRAAAGSVSDQVMRTSGVSVLVVHPTLEIWRTENAGAPGFATA